MAPPLVSLSGGAGYSLMKKDFPKQTIFTKKSEAEVIRNGENVAVKTLAELGFARNEALMLQL